MKNLMISFVALCAISTSTIAADIFVPETAAPEAVMKITTSGKTLVDQKSSALGFWECTPFPQYPWERRCP